MTDANITGMTAKKIKQRVIECVDTSARDRGNNFVNMAVSAAELSPLSYGKGPRYQ
jgi:hypothetical protein